MSLRRRRRRRWPPWARRFVAARQADGCAECAMPLPEAWHLDHVVPFAFGGEDSLRNVQALCPNCHCAKSLAEAPKLARLNALRRRCGPTEVVCWHCERVTSSYFSESHSCCA